MIKKAFSLSSLLLVFGCSSPLTKVSPVTCNETDWERVGRCFGRNNEPELTKNYFPQLCAKKTMPVDQAAFDRGFSQGRKEVCSDRRLAYFYAASFCRSGATKDIQTAIDDGLTAKYLRKRLADLEGTRRKAQRDADDSDTPDNALVNAIIAPAGYAVDGKGSIGPSKESIQEDISKDQQDLNALNKKYYPMQSPDVFEGPCNALVKDTWMSNMGLAPTH